MSSEVEKDFQNLVYYRIQALPSDTEMSIGGVGNLTKSELLDHVKKLDDIGKTIIDVEREFFGVLKSGELYSLYEA